MTSSRRVSGSWVVLGAMVTIIALGMGALFSLAVFLKAIEESMRWSRGAISLVALVNWIALGGGALAGGALSDRLGARVIGGSGSLLVGLGLVLASQAVVLWQFHVAFGVLVGTGVGAVYAALTANAARWFTRNRGLAVAITSAGIGLGVMTMAPLARWLISLYDWRGAMLLIGDLVWLVAVPMSVLLRPPDSPIALATDSSSIAPDFSASEVFRAREFWVISFAHFACCAAHSGPLFHMVAHAMDQGIDKMAAATVLSISSFASIVGRLGFGMLADRFGAKRPLIVGLAMQAAMTVLYLFTYEVWSFYAVGLMFGVSYGGVMPLYALLARECFGDRVVGTAYGAIFFISALGMGLGSFAGGWIFDHSGSYSWLFVGASAVGFGAVLIALGFRAEKNRRRPAVAFTAS
jgi:MFS family permease